MLPDIIIEQHPLIADTVTLLRRLSDVSKNRRGSMVALPGQTKTALYVGTRLLCKNSHIIFKRSLALSNSQITFLDIAYINPIFFRQAFYILNLFIRGFRAYKNLHFCNSFIIQIEKNTFLFWKIILIF